MPVTRCPECATAFRVTDDQLRMRAGKVRCGHCGEVFDALAALESETPALVALDAPPPPPPAEPVPAEPLAEPPLEPTAGPEERQATPSTAEEFVREEPGSPSTPPTAKPAEPELSFREPAAAGSGHRVLWASAALLLFVALLAQIAFYLRGPAALLWPQAKPFLEAACQRLGCEIPLPRRAELVSIETSDLQADPGNPGVMVLAATLRNRAAFPQAFPALELTLTNERDQPLARRVLEPRDYLRGAGQQAFAGSSELQVRLFIEAAALKASGYRLYLFYP